jgi:hypothetical protein
MTTLVLVSKTWNGNVGYARYVDRECTDVIEAGGSLIPADVELFRKDPAALFDPIDQITPGATA